MQHSVLDRISREVHKHEAPALHEMVARLADKAGIETPPIRIIDARVKTVDPLSVSMRYNAFATLEKEGKLLIGDMMLEHMTGNAHGTVVNQKLEALLGHEIAHLKYDAKEYSMAAYATKMPLIGLLTGLGGLAIYRHMQSKPAEQQKTEFEHGSEVLKQCPGLLTRAGQLTLVTGQYLAAGALGFATGVMALRDIRHFCEFRADRYAADMLNGNADAVVDMLRTIHAPPKQMLQSISQDTRKALNDAGLHEIDLQTLSDVQQYIGKLTHPSMEERVARLEEMKKGVGKDASKASDSGHDLFDWFGGGSHQPRNNMPHNTVRDPQHHDMVHDSHDLSLGD